MPRQFIFLLCGVLKFSAFATYTVLTSNFCASTFFFLFLHFSHKKEAGLEALTPKPAFSLVILKCLSISSLQLILIFTLLYSAISGLIRTDNLFNTHFIEFFNKLIEI